MKSDLKIESWLKKFELKIDSETIKLNSIQLHDTNLFFYKNPTHLYNENTVQEKQ